MIINLVLYFVDKIQYYNIKEMEGFTCFDKVRYVKIHTHTPGSMHWKKG